MRKLIISATVPQFRNGIIRLVRKPIAILRDPDTVVEAKELVAAIKRDSGPMPFEVGFTFVNEVDLTNTPSGHPRPKDDDDVFS